MKVFQGRMLNRRRVSNNDKRVVLYCKRVESGKKDLEFAEADVTQKEVHLIWLRTFRPT